MNKKPHPQDTETFQKFLDCFITPIAYLDKEFNFIFVNQAYAKAVNREPDCFPGQNHFDLYPDSENQQKFQRVVETGEPYKCITRPFEYTEHPDRNITYWDWELNLVKNEDNLQGLMLSLIDVTERVIIEGQQSHNLLIQEIVASILRLSLQPLPFKEFLRQALVFALQANNLDLAPQGVIFLLNPESDELEMAVRHGLPDSIVSSCARIRRGECICGMALEQEKLVFTSCVDEHHHVTYPGMSSHGHYCIPIKSQREVLGVLNLYVEHGHKRNRVEEQFVTTIADTLASAILKERTSKVLKESEKRFRAITETARDAIITINTNGEIISWNRGAEWIFGYTYEEIISQPVTKIMPARYHNVHDKAVEQWRMSVGTQHADSPMEVIGLRKDGTEISVEILLSYWNLENCKHITGIIRDITQRKKAEIELQIAATAFEANVGIMVTDSRGVIVKVNKTFTEHSGYSAEEAIGQTPRLFKSDRHDAAFYAAMWESINLNGTWEGEIWDRRKNGEIYPKWLNITAIKGENGAVSYFVGTQTDITERKVSENEIKMLAFYDSLTSLPNRRLLQDRLQQALASSVRNEQVGALLFLDLDHFKTINDTFGHVMGDLLLQEVAQRLTAIVREGDTVARLGGDEFVVMLEELGKELLEAATQAEIIAEKILAVLNQPYLLNGQEYYSTSSIGITLFKDHETEIEELFKQADIAMYEAKKAGRNILRFFDPKTQKAINTRVVLEGELRNALERQQLHLYYQIQVDDLNCANGAEALIRWIHPEHGLVSPAQFIPLAEESGLILPIGQWVLEMACMQLKAWQKDVQTRDLTLAVNVSAKQFRQIDFTAHVQAIVQQHNIKPKLLKLELTESMLLENIEKTIATMNELKTIGVGLSLDDFGTGYSSLQYLKQLPLNQLKIDQSFVRDLAVDDSDKAIVTTIIALAHGLNMEVIAEGVETKEQREYLLYGGCRHYQGYLFSKPVPIEQFEAFLECDRNA